MVDIGTRPLKAKWAWSPICQSALGIFNTKKLLLFVHVKNNTTLDTDIHTKH